MKLVRFVTGLILGAGPVPVWAQAGGEGVADADATEATVAADAEASRLNAELSAISGGDPSKDPAGDLEKLAALKRGFDAHGAMPLVDRGLLESAFGGAHFYLKQYDVAISHYEAAAKLFVDGNAPPDEIAGLYNNIATILASMARFDEAMAYHQRALALRRTIEGERGKMVSSSLFGIAFVLFRQGRIEESLPYFRDSVEQQVEFQGPGHYNTITRMTSLASVLGRAGRENEALAVARRAEALAREHLGLDHPTYAIALNNLGNALIENGLHAQAIPVLRQTLDLRLKVVGEQASGTAISLRNLSTALKQAGALEEAEALQRRAIAIFEASGETDTPEALPYMYAEMADYAARRGDAGSYAEWAARSMAEADKRLNEADHDRAAIYLYHADRLNEAGDTAQALAIAERWVPVMQAALIADHKDRIAAEALLALLRQKAGQSHSSQPLADQTLAKLQKKLADLSLSEGRMVREAESNRLTAVRLLDLALRSNDQERAFAALQLATISDLSLGQMASEPGMADATSGAPAMRRHLIDLARKETELRVRHSASFEAGDPSATAELGKQLDAAIIEREAADADLRQRYPDYVSRLRPQPITLNALLERLGDNDLVLSTVESDSAGWVITVTRSGGLSARKFDPRRARTLVNELRGTLTTADRAASFPLGAAAELGAMILPANLETGTNILTYGGRDLATLPPGMLLTEGFTGPIASAPWLVRKATVRVIGNLELFAQAAPSGQAEPRTGKVQMAGIGGAMLPSTAVGSGQIAPLFRSGGPLQDDIAALPALPNAELELRAIADALPGRDDVLLIGNAAQEERIKQTDLSRANLIAFATHGLVSGELRGLWEPALLLGTTPGSGEDGLLGASEIAQLRLNAEWVILSACNTAAGDTSGAPAYSGLATAFAQAGARGLMLSHWRVRDDAAARLTVGTVRGWAEGLSRAEALRRAQLALMADRTVPDAAHPAIWAPFVIIEN